MTGAPRTGTPGAGTPGAGTCGVSRGMAQGLRFLAARGLARLVRAIGFVVEPVDELVTARLGVPAVLPRLRRWCRHVVTEWRAYRVGVIEAEVMEGVWR